MGRSGGTFTSSGRIFFRRGSARLQAKDDKLSSLLVFAYSRRKYDTSERK
jgi:hypothetical protein